MTRHRNRPEPDQPAGEAVIDDVVRGWAAKIAPDLEVSWTEMDAGASIGIRLSNQHGATTHVQRVDSWSGADVRKALDTIRAEQIQV